MKPKGAESKYKSEYCNKLVEVRKNGGFISAVCAAIGIKPSTYHRWKVEYPEWKEACEVGDIYSQALLEELGMKAIRGEIKNFNSKTYELMMTHKFGNEYKSATNNTEITINQLNLTQEQITDKIQQKLQKLKSLGIDIEKQQ